MMDDLYFSDNSDESLIFDFQSHIKKITLLQRVLKNLLSKYSFSLAEIYIQYDGVEESLEAADTATFASAKVHVIIGNKSFKNFIANITQCLPLQYLYISNVDAPLEFPLIFRNMTELTTVTFNNLDFIELPDSIQNLTHLVGLELDYCSKLTAFPKEIVQLQELRHIEINHCLSLAELPVEFAYLKKLFCIHFNYLPNLKNLFEIQVGQLCELKTFELTFCPNLKVLPEQFDALSNLDYLEIIACHQLELKEDQFKHLVSLKSLNLENCENLTSLPLPNGQQHLKVQVKNCPNIDLRNIQFRNKLNRSLDYETFMTYQVFLQSNMLNHYLEKYRHNEFEDSNFGLKLDAFKQNIKQIDLKLFEQIYLNQLTLNRFIDLIELPKEIAQLKKLHKLELNRCIALKFIPNELARLNQLKSLKIIRSYDLITLPDEIGQLVNLEILDLSACIHLERLPESIGELKNLKMLKLARCEKLLCLPDQVKLLDNLELLHLSGCTALDQLPDFTFMCRLKVLHLSGCLFKALPNNFKSLENLEILHLSGNEDLEILPIYLIDFKNLKKIFISGCHSLKNLSEFEKYNKHIQIMRRVIV